MTHKVQYNLYICKENTNSNTDSYKHFNFPPENEKSFMVMYDVVFFERWQECNKLVYSNDLGKRDSCREIYANVHSW